MSWVNANIGLGGQEEESLEGSTEGCAGIQWEWPSCWEDGQCGAGMSFPDRERGSMTHVSSGRLFMAGRTQVQWGVI